MSCATNHPGHGDHEEDEMQVADSEGVEESNENFAESSTEMTNTCEALCSLSCSPPPASSAASVDSNDDKSSRRSTKGCPKQHQLPMFLSKTYHMIDRCDPDVATWSASGDNFVVKSTDKFAQDILPMYFKHSNFSSFARQLNFYGFRKLKAEPILTADFDARTACYVRFYHEKFQKDKPEMLTQIKRATKSEMQSKDDVDSLRGELCRMKDTMQCMSVEFDRRLSEMSYEYNRRISALTVEYDKLAVLVQQLIASKGVEAIAGGGPSSAPDMLRSLTHAALSLQGRTPLSLTTATELDHGKKRARPVAESDKSSRAASKPRAGASEI